MAHSIEVRQPLEGYRYSVDPFILADNITAQNVRRVVDLGTGNGILPLLLSKLYPAADFWGLDIQREPLLCAARNCKKSGVRGRFIQSDIRDAASFLKAGSFDLAVSNPPYRKAGSGRINPVRARAIARHEIKLTLAELVRAAGHLLEEGGVFSMIHLAGRSAEVLRAMTENRLAPYTVRFVYSKNGGNANWVIVNSVKNGKNDLTVKPPFIVYSPDGGYAPEMSRIYEKFDI